MRAVGRLDSRLLKKCICISVLETKKKCLFVINNYGRKLAAIIGSGEISSLKGGHV